MNRAVLTILCTAAVLVGGYIGLGKMVNASLAPPSLHDSASPGIVTNAPRR